MNFLTTFRNLILILLPLLFIGCEEDIVETDSELVPYFDVFAAEAAERGIVVDYDAARIEGLIQNIAEPSVLGRCFRNDDRPRKVIIDVTYWNSASESEREFLIFHELGHCFLDRDHLNTSDETGVCISIMHESPQVCLFDLNESNREQYFDELFFF